MPLKKVSMQEYSRRIQKRFPNESFSVLVYESLGKPAVVKCLNCGQEIHISKASNFLAKNKAYGCVNCHGLWRERSKKWAEILEKYDVEECGVKNTHKYYSFTCKRCGHVRKTTLKNIYEHLDCGCTTGVYRRTEQEVRDILSDRYELVSAYNDTVTKIKLKCKICGFVWDVRLADVLRGASCPHCQGLDKQSKGEHFIEQYLLEKGISYEREYPLKNSRQRFDFYLPEYNIAIEYQGKQHYKYIKYFHHTYQGFKKSKERDKRKREYCTENGILLLEIPYSWKDTTIVAYLDSNLGFNDYPEKE